MVNAVDIFSNIKTDGEQVVDELMAKKFKAFLTGSAVIGTTGTINDYDVVVVWSPELVEWLEDNDYIASEHSDTEYPNSSIVTCYRNGDINIIAVTDDYAYNTWMLATDLAMSLCLHEKRHRVTLFQFITEGQVRDNRKLSIDRLVRKEVSPAPPYKGGWPLSA